MLVTVHAAEFCLEIGLLSDEEHIDYCKPCCVGLMARWPAAALLPGDVGLDHPSRPSTTIVNCDVPTTRPTCGHMGADECWTCNIII